MPRPRLLVPALCFAAVVATLLSPRESFAQRTSVVADFPIYDNAGKPDLMVDWKRFVSQMEIVDRYFSPEDCAIAEEVVGGYEVDVLRDRQPKLAAGRPPQVGLFQVDPVTR